MTAWSSAVLLFFSLPQRGRLPLRLPPLWWSLCLASCRQNRVLWPLHPHEVTFLLRRRRPLPHSVGRLFGRWPPPSPLSPWCGWVALSAARAFSVTEVTREGAIRVDVERVLHDLRDVWGDVEAHLFADAVIVGKLSKLPPNRLCFDGILFHGSLSAFVFGFSKKERGQWSEMVALVSAIFAFLMKCCGAEVAI
jgi:hypothetical protein